jgi:hypothetical protein
MRIVRHEQQQILRKPTVKEHQAVSVHINKKATSKQGSHRIAKTLKRHQSQVSQRFGKVNRPGNVEI